MTLTIMEPGLLGALEQRCGDDLVAWDAALRTLSHRQLQDLASLQLSQLELLEPFLAFSPELWRAPGREFERQITEEQGLTRLMAHAVNTGFADAPRLDLDRDIARDQLDTGLPVASATTEQLQAGILGARRFLQALAERLAILGPFVQQLRALPQPPDWEADWVVPPATPKPKVGKPRG